MLGWILNLWGGGAAPGPPPVPPGGSSHRRGSIWEPSVALAVEDALRARLLAKIAAEEAELLQSREREDTEQRIREQSELDGLLQTLREYDKKEAELKAHAGALAEKEREAQRYAKFGKRKRPGLMQFEEEREAVEALKVWLASQD
jgi:hypothetical protein